MWGPIENYYTDFVRSTVVGGEPTSAQRELLDGSISLIEHLIDGIRPGVTAGSVYERGAAWLLANGFAEHQGSSEDAGTVFGNLFPAFGHSIGLGLEAPWLTEGEPTVLVPNMVLAVECMVGRPGVGAAGFEQDVLVTSGGCEVLAEGCPARWWK